MILNGRIALALFGALLLASVAAAVVVRTEPSRVDACAFESNPDTYEHLNYKSDYAYLMDLAAWDLLFPGDPEFGRQQLDEGTRSNRRPGSGHIPPVLLRSIGFVESAWQMASSSVAYGGTGEVLAAIIGDCGYGLMQVTSGMTVPLAPDDQPSQPQGLIATHVAYNIARGAGILANKWNEAPEFRPIVGSGNPSVLEHWYFAVWGYNGFAFVNHPFSPRFSSLVRPQYSCNPNDSFGHDRSQYPYQELVFGCVAHPAVRDGAPLWQPQAISLPNLTDAPVKKALDPANFVHPYSKMDLPEPRTTHRDTSSRPDTSLRGSLVGDPNLQVTAAPVALDAPAPPGSAPPTFTISNVGAGTGAWLTTATVPWLRTDPPAGVALGADVACAPGAACDPTASVEIVIDEGELERGSNEAELQVWSLQQPGVMVSIPVSVSSTGPPPRPSPSPAAPSTGTPSPNETPSPTPPAPSERTDVVAAELVAGCNPIGSAFPDGTPVAEVLASVEPDSVVTAVWRLPQPEGPWELLIPGQDAVSTLDAVNAHDGLFICTEGRTVVSQTIVIEGSGERTTMLQPGCNFVAAARASTSAAFLSHVVPEDGVLALWWLDAREGHWLVYLPPAPAASSLDRVDRLAGVFVCMEGQGELRQLDLVP